MEGKDVNATLGQPRAIVIAGNAGDELVTQAKRESFELFRHRLEGVTVITYDELFARLATSVALLEGVSPGAGAMK